MSQIIQRLEYLSNGRAFYTWLGNIGVVRSSVNRVKKQGGNPTEAIIIALQRCENVNREWLLEGKGSPYVVHDVKNDEMAADDVLAHLEDEPWSTYVVTDGLDCVVVLTQPCTFLTQRKKEIPYTAIEVIPNADNKTLSVINEWATDVYRINTLSETLNKLKSGEMGTYQLIEQDNALLSGAKKIPMVERKSLFMTLPNSIEEPSDKAYSMQFTDEEKNFFDLFQQLEEEDKDLIKKLILKLS